MRGYIIPEMNGIHNGQKAIFTNTAPEYTTTVPVIFPHTGNISNTVVFCDILYLKN
ncbi:hypothetical protein CLV59_102420 [Chitinophaga dinghuensis]|uniref:Uncharacterized protein n=1 Tax=Chitinophaga dinghuensis TaxID=1539050 RepID=A0A327W5M9_9BACT|nr:hypothetical protein CLV59_102420 [Chitinophaga dinghuensis]